MVKKQNIPRPTSITVLCILGFIGTIVALFTTLWAIRVPSVLASLDYSIPTWYLIFSIILSLFIFISLLYVWKMRKIGVIIYTIFMIVNFIVSFVISYKSVVGFIFPIVNLVFFWIHFKKMS